MPFLDGARPLLAAVGVLALVVGAWPLFWLTRRLGGVLFRRDQVPVGRARYLLAFTTGVLLVSIGFCALGLWMALSAYEDLGKKTPVAEVQCIQMAPSKLRVYYVPIERDGRRGATETYDLDGDEWTVGGDVLRFRPLLTHFGVDTVYQVTRVEGRWLKAEDANAHKATAHDRGVTGRGWLALYRDGTRGPLGWLIAGAHGQAVSQLPDRRAVYDVFMTPNGFTVEKKTF
jgi:hypothetical protein